MPVTRSAVATAVRRRRRGERAAVPRRSRRMESKRDRDVTRITWSGSAWNCRRFYTRGLPYVLALLFVPLAAFVALGNPQWSRASFIFQYYVWPADPAIDTPPAGYTGTFRNWSNYGDLTYEAEYVNGALHGRFWCIYTGGVREESHYSNGFKDGPSTTWFTDGRIELITYSAGVYDGEYVYWHGNGQKAVEKRFAAGKLDGVARAWLKNGQLASEVNYNKGKRDGLFRSWHLNGQLKEKIVYAADNKEGVFESWHDNGHLAVQGVFANNLRVGLWKQWYRDGAMKSSGRYDETGRKTGLWHIWYGEDRLLAEREYAGGAYHGCERMWYRTGEKRSVKNFVHGRLHGLCTIWRRDGTVLSSCEYARGRPVTGSVFNRLRNKRFLEIYEEGKLVSEQDLSDDLDILEEENETADAGGGEITVNDPQRTRPLSTHATGVPAGVIEIEEEADVADPSRTGPVSTRIWEDIEPDEDAGEADADNAPPSPAASDAGDADTELPW